MTVGSICSSLMVVLEGEARAEMTNDEGKTFAVEILRAGEAVATAILFSPRKIMPVTLVAAKRTSLAELFGVARPSLSRELGEMEKRGYIAMGGRDIRILDREGLRSLRSL